MSIAKALHSFQARPPAVHLDATNPHFRNKYASLGGVVEAIRPALNKAGLVYTQLPTTVDGKPALRTVLMHAESGDSIEDTMLLVLDKDNSQGQGSALTYARRYALLSILGLVGDEDDDAAAASKDSGRGGQRAGSGGSSAAAFQPPPGVTGDGNGFAASRADHVPPTDGGDPLLVRVHFGKNAEKTLGELTQKQREWYANTWEPNPDFANDADRRLKMAAQILCGVTPTSDDTDEIPF